MAQKKQWRKKPSSMTVWKVKKSKLLHITVEERFRNRRQVSEHSPKSTLRGSCMYPIWLIVQQDTASFSHLHSLLQPFLFFLFSLLLQFFILGQDGGLILWNLFVEHFCHGICPACTWASFGACCLFNHITKGCCFIFIITIQGFTSWRVAVFWKSWA